MRPAAGLQPGMGVLYVSGYTEDLVARQGVVEEALESPVSQASPL